MCKGVFKVGCVWCVCVCAWHIVCVCMHGMLCLCGREGGLVGGGGERDRG